MLAEVTRLEDDKQIVRDVILPDHVGISGIYVEFMVKPFGKRTGAKCPAQIGCTLGGCAPNGVRVATANCIGSGLVGPQASGVWADLSRALAETAGLCPFIIEREGDAGITIAHLNGSPGSFNLDVQRLAPLSVKELVGFFDTVLKGPRSVFVGPTQLNEESEAFHQIASRAAPRSALMAHPSLLSDSELFRRVGRLYDYVQMNLTESALLDPGEKNLEKLACRVRYLLEDRDFAITNAGEPGLAWIERNWYPIMPCEVRTMAKDIGGGDVWGTAFVLARWYFEASPGRALSYANLAAAAWISGRSIPPHL